MDGPGDRIVAATLSLLASPTGPVLQAPDAAMNVRRTHKVSNKLLCATLKTQFPDTHTRSLQRHVQSILDRVYVVYTARCQREGLDPCQHAELHNTSDRAWSGYKRSGRGAGVGCTAQGLSLVREAARAHALGVGIALCDPYETSESPPNASDSDSG